MKLTSIFFTICLNLNSSFVMAASDLQIEVCMVPLREIVVDIVKLFAGNLQHVFIRGADKTGLNFEPVKRFEIFNSEGRIGHQNYANARCEALITTQDVNEYNKNWQKFVSAFDEIARNYRYDILLQNCQWATKKVLKELGYPMPPGIGRALCETQGC